MQVQQLMSNNSPKPHPLLRIIRSQPYVYSTMCKSLLFYSRHVAAKPERTVYKQARSLFSMTDLETKHCDELRNQGFTILHRFFSFELVDRIYEKADKLFKALELDFYDAYSVQNGWRSSLKGLSYEELEASEKMVALQNPLLNIPECVHMTFNESILKIVSNFLRCVPSWYKPMIVRDFPSNRPKEASNFHRDNDEADSIQIFVYLVDIDDTRGPLIYIPGTNKYDVRSCRPRLNRDLGINADDGRISDVEIEKYYPKETWKALRIKRGSIAIIHGNGLHKGPSWPRYGDPANKPRTALRLDITGPKLRGNNTKVQERKIRRPDFEQLNSLQRLFARNFVIID